MKRLNDQFPGKSFQQIFLWILMFVVVTCTDSVNAKPNKMSNNFPKGTYGYDVAFFKKQKVATVELKDHRFKARVLLVPGYEGRVMTSSASGENGNSFGWINYDLVGSGKISKQFNPYGGEERFWIGPEGGPFSIFFGPEKKQVFENWNVPPVLDTESFNVVEADNNHVVFEKSARLKNASGTTFDLDIKRQVSLLDWGKLCSLLGIHVPKGHLNVVAYQSENTITNTGDKAWTKDSGLLSIWMLCMFNPSPTTTVFIPYRQDASGDIVHDGYFGKVPPDRLIVENGTVYFKIDGKYRSKIGIPPNRAKNLLGSFDSSKNILTLLWCSLPSKPQKYVNSQWGHQDDPYAGDAVNSYNDGPVADGSIMGPFYEMETSSPAAALAPGESITHIQRMVHIQGNREELAKLVKSLFSLGLDDIASKFKH